MSRSVLVLGASSGIARGTANALAAKGYRLFLAGRDEQDLSAIASDIAIRYDAQLHYGRFDAMDFESHPSFLEQVTAEMGNLYGVVFAVGYLGEQERAIVDFEETKKIISTNYLAGASILNLCAQKLEIEGEGFIIGISSVAGDRGRQSNFIYGSAKGAFSTYLQGLRNRLSSSGVRVITVKPGFVDTGMTFGLPGLFLVASPNEVGRKIILALDRSRDIVYLPWFWRYIMLIIRAIPEAIFKRLKL